jgi:hypothetical protein
VPRPARKVWLLRLSDGRNAETKLLADFRRELLSDIADPSVVLTELADRAARLRLHLHIADREMVERKGPAPSQYAALVTSYRQLLGQIDVLRRGFDPVEARRRHRALPKGNGAAPADVLADLQDALNG